jgi:hypothetical protein
METQSRISEAEEDDIPTVAARLGRVMMLRIRLLKYIEKA